MHLAEKKCIFESIFASYIMGVRHFGAVRFNWYAHAEFDAAVAQRG